MLGFLTLKEPSTSAWEEFAEAQRKVAAQKGKRSSTLGVPGVSSQKLPDFVPKTNSKWDGLPDSAKGKSSDAKAKDRTNRNSTFSTSTRQTRLSSKSEGSGDQSPARRFGSLSSKPRPHSSSLAQSKRGSVQSSVSADEPRRVSYRAPAPTTIHPALRDNLVTPWEEPPEVEQQLDQEPDGSHQTFLHPPSPPPMLPEHSSLLPLSDIDLREIPYLEHYGASPHVLTSPEASPQTPPADNVRGPFVPVAEQYSYVPVGDQNAIAQEVGTFWHSDTDNEELAVKPARPAALRAPLNFSRPRVMRSATPTTDEEYPLEPTIEEEDEESDTLQPTLQEDGGRMSPFRFQETSNHSRHASTLSQAATSIGPTRTCSTSSRLTSITTTTATTVTQPLRSPTFSDASPGSTRSSTPTSTINTATAHRRSSPSPIRSNSDTASMAPSEMSARWTLSPRERLGLGGKVTRRVQADALPWEMEEPPGSGTLTSASVKRQSGLSQNTLEGGKLKRLSMKLSRK